MKKLLAVLAATVLAVPLTAFAQQGGVVMSSGGPVKASGQDVRYTGKGDPGVIPAGPSSGK